jgi:hypothetical protein
MSRGELERKFDHFSNAVRGNDVLDPKTTLVLHLATAMAVGCSP